MNKFKKWDGKMLEDWGTTMSDEAKAFYRAFKNYLKREFPGAELTGFKPNHYDFSGFLTLDGKVVYISHSLNRVGYEALADFSDRSCMNGVLYRTAKDTKDFRGGTNHFTSIYSLACAIRHMVDNYDHLAKAA